MQRHGWLARVDGARGGGGVGLSFEGNVQDVGLAEVAEIRLPVITRDFAIVSDRERKL